MVWRWNSMYSGVAKEPLPPDSRQRLRCSYTSLSMAASRPAGSFRTKKRSASAAADEAQHEDRHAEHDDLLNIEGEDADRLTALERDEEPQRLAGAVDLPPLVLEEPRVEHARGHGLRVQAIPVRGEAREFLRR